MKHKLIGTMIIGLVLLFAFALAGTVSAGVTTANGWYEGEEIYYINHESKRG